MNTRNDKAAIITNVPVGQTVSNMVKSFLDANSIVASQHTNHIVKQADKMIRAINDRNMQIELCLIPSNSGNRYWFILNVRTYLSNTNKMFKPVVHPSGIAFLNTVNWMGVAGMTGRIREAGAFIECRFCQIIRL